MADDPNWPRASAWLAGDHMPDPVATLAVLGAPMRLGSISGGRFDLTPAAIRQALARFSTWDGKRDVRAVRVTDLEDLPLSDVLPADARSPVEHALQSSAGDDARILLGGDNSITCPGVLALDVPLIQVGLITLDAHHDLRDTEAGLMNGNPVRALLEDGLPGQNIVQIGIQPFANSAAYAAVAREAGITVVTAEEVRRRGIGVVMTDALAALAAGVGAIYVDLDVDVLDRAFAPACPGSRPGGLLPQELFTAARMAGAHPKVTAMDIVEVDPERDVADITVLTAARCLLEFAAGLATRAR